MASKKRVSEDSVVAGSPRILPKDHPDLVFFNPNKVLVTDSGKVDYRSFLNVPPGDRDDDGEGTGPTGPSGPTGPEDPDDPDIPEKVDLSDIESIEFFETQNNVGVTVYTAKIKVRNSAKNKDAIDGVDARIYKPRGGQ